MIDGIKRIKHSHRSIMVDGIKRIRRVRVVIRKERQIWATRVLTVFLLIATLAYFNNIILISRAATYTLTQNAWGGTSGNLVAAAPSNTTWNNIPAQPGGGNIFFGDNDTLQLKRDIGLNITTTDFTTGDISADASGNPQMKIFTSGNKTWLALARNPTDGFITSPSPISPKVPAKTGWGKEPDVTVDGKGAPYIAFGVSDGNELRLASYVGGGVPVNDRCNDSMLGDTWKCELIDANGPSIHDPAITIVNDTIFIAYQSGGDGIRIASKGPLALGTDGSLCLNSAWHCIDVEVNGGSMGNPSIEHDESGNLFVSYVMANPDGSGKILQLQKISADGSIKIVLDNSVNGSNLESDLAVDKFGGVHIAYKDARINASNKTTIKYVYHSSPVSFGKGCDDAKTTWQCERLGDFSTSSRFPKIALKYDGTKIYPYLVYFHGGTNTIRYAKRNSSLDASSYWQEELVTKSKREGAVFILNNPTDNTDPEPILYAPDSSASSKTLRIEHNTIETKCTENIDWSCEIIKDKNNDSTMSVSRSSNGIVYGVFRWTLGSIVENTGPYLDTKKPYTSATYQNSFTVPHDQFNSLSWTATTPPNTNLLVEVRTQKGEKGSASYNNALPWCTTNSTGSFGTPNDLLCITNSDPVLEYKITMGGTGFALPAISNISLTYSAYKTEGKLYSNIFNTGSDIALVNAVQYQLKSPLPTGTNVELFVRTGASAPPAGAAANDVSSAWPGWTDWCGRNNGSGVPPCPGLSAEGITETFPSVDEDLANGNVAEQFFQYLVRISSPLGNATPVVDQVAVNFVINSPPEVTNVSATQKQVLDSNGDPDSNAGKVVVSYDLNDPDEGTQNLEVYLFYDIGIKLDGSSMTLNQADMLLSGPISRLPQDGILQVDNEFLSYVGFSGGNQLTVTRQENGSTASSHSVGATVWIMAPNITGDVGISADSPIKLNPDNTTLVTEGTGKSIIWTVASDISEYYADPPTTGTFHVQVTASDQEHANQIGSGAISLKVDTAKPNIASMIINDNAPKTNNPTVNLRFTGVSDDTVPPETLTMDLTNNPDALPQWLYTYSNPFTGWSISPDDGLKTVSVKLRDIYNNTSIKKSDTITLDQTPPSSPGTFSVQGVCVNNSDEPFLTWDATTPNPGDFMAYKIYRDGTQIASIDTSTVIAPIVPIDVTFYADVGVGAGTYVYGVEAVDDIGNPSPRVTASPFTVGACDVIDETPPTISNIATGTPMADSITVTWDTDEDADAFVAFSKDTSFNTLQGNSVFGLAHSVTVVGLEPNTTYNYFVRSTDRAGNTGTSTQAQFTTSPGADTTAPVITNARVEPAVRSATFHWDTTGDPSTSFVEITGADGARAYGTFDLVENHTVVLPSVLNPGAGYTATLVSTDGFGNRGEQQVSFTTDPDTSDTTGPIIATSTIAVSGITSSSATITWEVADEPANSFVEYGKVDGTATTTIFDKVEGSYELVAQSPGQHSVTLTGLEESTPYNYRVRSTDGSGNETIYPLGTGALPFKTLSGPAVPSNPVISNVQISSVAKTSAVIEWQTDQDADSFVDYSANNQSYSLMQGSARTVSAAVAGVARHQVTVRGLSPGTQYYFQVRSKTPAGTSASYNQCLDSGGVLGDCAFFTTVSGAAPPVIDEASITAANITEHSAVIQWTTDIAASSIVDIGFQSGAYNETFAIVNETPTTQHSVELPNHLLANTRYYYRVRSAVNDGIDDVEAISYPGDPAMLATLNFTTLSSGITDAANDNVKPEILYVDDPPLVVTSNSAVITFTTDELTYSEVDVGVNTQFDSFTELGVDLSFIHSILLDGLDPDTTYYYRVRATDLAENAAEDDNSGAGYTFTTLEEATAGTGQATPAPTPGDTTPPIISNVRVIDVTASGATVTWQTDESSASIVEYGTEQFTYPNSIGQTSNFITDHRVTLDGLAASTTYYFVAVGFDTNANRSQSEQFSFTTEGISPDEQALNELQNKLAEETSAREVELLSAFSDLSTTTQELVQNFLEALDQIAEVERDKALEFIFGEFTGPPRILGAKPNVDLTDTTAVIQWETLKETTSIVSYASAGEYDADTKDSYTKETGDDNSFVTSHKVILTELKPFTEYHYQLVGEERNGRLGLSIDRVFKTLPIQPKFEAVKLRALSEQAATIFWKTNVPTVGVVSLRNRATGEGITKEVEEFHTKHEVTIKGLDSRTRYSAIISAKSEEQVVVKSDPFSFTTKPDSEPPIIQQVRTKLSLAPGKTDIVQAVISWKTDEPATAQVLFDEGISAKGELSQSSALQSDFSITHVVVITKLRPATIYTFRAVSIDASGNRGVSREFKMFTPRKQESVLELIIKNFETTFGFLQRTGRQ